MPKTFDPACYRLACWFLDDCKGVTEAKRSELASRIQQTVDDYGEELMDEDEAAYDRYIDQKIDEWREASPDVKRGMMAQLRRIR